VLHDCRQTMILSPNLEDFFIKKLNSVDCHESTRAYIISIFVKYKAAQHDLSQESVTLLYSDARTSQSFEKFQNLADWIFFIDSIFPENLQYASPEYYHTIAKLSYYSCYKLINKQWKLFEELSDNYEFITNNIKSKIKL